MRSCMKYYMEGVIITWPFNNVDAKWSVAVNESINTWHITHHGTYNMLRRPGSKN